MKLTRKFYYMDLQRGDLLTAEEMLDRLEDEYGFGDYTPMSEMWNYFDLTGYPVSQ